MRTLQPEFLLFCPKITKNTTVTLYPNTGSIISSQNLSIIFNQKGLITFGQMLRGWVSLVDVGGLALGFCDVQFASVFFA